MGVGTVRAMGVRADRIPAADADRVTGVDAQLADVCRAVRVMPQARFSSTRREALALLGSAGAATLPGCSDGLGGASSDPAVGSRSAEGSGEPGSPASHVTVTATSDPYPKFEPQVVHVAEGGTVEWVVEIGRHDVTGYHRDRHPPHCAPEDAEPWGSERMSVAGATYERTFDRQGVYDYADTQQVCVAHEIAGNVGRVIVGWPDPDEEPAIGEPEGDVPRRVRNAFEFFDEETVPVLEAGP